MTEFARVNRPPKNRRTLGDAGDEMLEAELLTTLLTTQALLVPLALFHTSPVKGRLWKRGYRVLHRVLGDRQTVAAWVEPGPDR